MDRLLVFGCSYSYGYALDDLNQTVPSSNSWAKIISSKLNLRLVNLSLPGSSNLQILNNILNTNFLANDRVIVQWSFANRDMIFLPKKDPVQIGPWETYEYYKQWVLIHNLHDLKTRSLMYKHHAHCYLSSLNIKFNFLNIEEQYSSSKWASSINFLNTNFKDYIDNFPKALDDIHPGIDCHQKIAEEVYKELVL